MLDRLLNTMRLAWRLVRDPRVSVWLKIFLVGVPLAYAFFPMPGDFVPVVGLLDDVLFLLVSGYVFIALCPQALVAEHRREIEGHPAAGADLDAYRYPGERRDLAFGFAITFGIAALGGWLAGFLGLMLVGVGYLATVMARGRILASAVQITERQLPDLYRLVQGAQANLPPVQANYFVAQNPVMNAYTFGYDEPYTIVLTSGLVEKMAPAEVQAVIGHELGHVLLGHTRLINLMAGLGGLMNLLFYRWSRSCEYSADAIALLTSSGDPQPVVSAFLKLSSGLVDTQIDLDAFLDQVDEQTGASAAAAENFSTHPFINNRIRRLLELARSWPPQTAGAPGEERISPSPA